jgi:hypothetical protein
VSLADGTVVDKGGVMGALSIASAPGLPNLMGSSEGKVYEVLGGAWITRTSGVSPTYPG